MPPDEMGERTEKPTPRRMSEARGEGNVAKSTDLSGAVLLIASTVLLVVFGASLVRTMHAVVLRVLEGSAPGLEPSGGVDVGVAMAWVFTSAGKAVAPLMLILAIVAFVAQFSQVGPLLTAKPLKPKFNRLNPISGVKRLFSRRNLVKTVVNVLKLIFVVGIAVLTIYLVMPSILALPRLGATQGMYFILQLALLLAAWLLLALLLLGIIDLIYQRWQHSEDLKMTKQQVKDERRSFDGDPHVKRRRMEMASKLAMQRVNSAVPKADVVITNPTHFAVALKYDADSMHAPRVVAKGADLIAMRIRQVAAANAVPVVERPPLARGLFYGCEVGQEIPAKFYEAVAEILAYVYRTEKSAVA